MLVLSFPQLKLDLLSILGIVLLMKHYAAAVAVKITEFDLQNYLFLHSYVVET